ncbi:hypothetical protein HMPREF3183_00571 [Peptostreptococcus anaerobius]|nr:hypothetical protein HMPREF3183_00571 [Peptostreptococcus anaerobius]
MYGKNISMLFQPDIAPFFVLVIGSVYRCCSISLSGACVGMV